MPSNSDNRISRRFSTDVASDDSEEVTADVKADATVEQITIRFYRGPRLDLGVKPYVERKVREDRSRRIPVVDLHGSEFVRGDDDTWVFHVSQEVEEGDVIGVEAVNEDQNGHRYDFVCDFEIDRAGGSSRPFNGFLDTLGGLF